MIEILFPNRVYQKSHRFTENLESIENTRFFRCDFGSQKGTENTDYRKNLNILRDCTCAQRNGVIK